jgi:hypothetical protein
MNKKIHIEYFINKFVCTNPLTFKMGITRIPFSKDERMGERHLYMANRVHSRIWEKKLSGGPSS